MGLRKKWRTRKLPEEAKVALQVWEEDKMLHNAEEFLNLAAKVIMRLCGTTQRPERTGSGTFMIRHEVMTLHTKDLGALREAVSGMQHAVNRAQHELVGVEGRVSVIAKLLLGGDEEKMQMWKTHLHPAQRDLLEKLLSDVEPLLEEVSGLLEVCATDPSIRGFLDRPWHEYQESQWMNDMQVVVNKVLSARTIVRDCAYFEELALFDTIEEAGLNPEALGLPKGIRGSYIPGEKYGFRKNHW